MGPGSFSEAVAVMSDQNIPPNTTSQRVERKYPLTDDRMDAAMQELSAMLPVYRYNGAHDWSSIRTVYLDTEDHACYQEYLQDLPVRQKIRIRQYGVDGRFDDICWVEMKVKNKTLSLKRRFRCSVADVSMLLKGADVLDRIRRQNDSDVAHTYKLIRSAIVDRKLLPMVRVDYQRLSFQRPDDSTLRLTLDQQLRFCSATRDYQGELEGCVIEVKFTGTKPAWLIPLREKLELKRELRFSKFARSMKRIHKLRELGGSQ